MYLKVHGFRSQGTIPAQFSKLGGNISPAITFHDVPCEAKSLALIMDDPDAPRGLFTHWVVYNIPPDCTGFGEGAVPPGVLQGRNSWGDAAYGGPQPPDREHRYFFRLYALYVVLDIGPGATRGEVEREMEGQVVCEAEYMGRYAPHTAELAGRH